jgi:hypothetical protein
MFFDNIDGKFSCLLKISEDTKIPEILKKLDMLKEVKFREGVYSINKEKWYYGKLRGPHSISRRRSSVLSLQRRITRSRSITKNPIYLDIDQGALVEVNIDDSSKVNYVPLTNQLLDLDVNIPHNLYIHKLDIPESGNNNMTKRDKKDRLQKAFRRYNTKISKRDNNIFTVKQLLMVFCVKQTI